MVDATKTFVPNSWIETKTDCKEKAEVFVFVTEKFTIPTATLVFFGVGKVPFVLPLPAPRSLCASAATRLCHARADLVR